MVLHDSEHPDADYGQLKSVPAVWTVDTQRVLRLTNCGFQRQSERKLPRSPTAERSGLQPLTHHSNPFSNLTTIPAHRATHPVQCRKEMVPHLNNTILESHLRLHFRRTRDTSSVPTCPRTFLSPAMGHPRASIRQTKH